VSLCFLFGGSDWVGVGVGWWGGERREVMRWRDGSGIGLLQVHESLELES
jgi:hypothetical protein